MLPKHILEEIHKIEWSIKSKKERIDKLKRLSKLSKNIDLISEYDAIINQSTATLDYISELKTPMEPQKEQVITHSTAAVRLMAKGLKASLCDSDKQIELLNNAIEDDNIKIQGFKNSKNTNRGSII